MSTIDIALKHYEHGQFRLSLGIVDEIFESYQIAPLLEIKIHSHLELDQMDTALRTVEMLNEVEDRYHYRMLHLHVLSMMGRYDEALGILQDMDMMYGKNIGLNKLLERLIQ